MSEQIKRGEDRSELQTEPYKMELGCKVSRNYGNTTVEFQCRQIFDVTEKEQIHRYYNVLVTRINDQFKEFETYNQDKIIRPEGDVGQYKRLSEPQKFTLAALVVEVKDGKRLVKAKTREAQYAKFGVPIYQEVMDEYDIDRLMGDNLVRMFSHDVTLMVDTSTKNKKVIAFHNLPIANQPD